jgi:hypothetical protein
MRSGSSSISHLPSSDGRPRSVRVLELDGDLGARLPAADQAQALAHVVGDLHLLSPGLSQVPPVASTPLAMVVLDGPVLLERSVAGAVGVELLGDGDVMLGGHASPAGLLDVTSTFHVLRQTRVIALDARFGQAALQWPALGLAVLERVEQRIERIATLQAISQLVRVDARVLAALWHLGERWGHVTPEGLALRVPLTHRALARIIGGRRPSVTTALNELRRRGRIERRDDGWLLRGGPPAAAEEDIRWSPAASDGSRAAT